MQKQLVECVPNFSEGRDLQLIKQITNAIEAVEGVKLLDVDPGKATNRTVVTFVGEPEPVLEAAFQAMKKAQELIDMQKHKGEHPRFGATDVCPLVPVANITMEEVAALAHRLAERVGNELDYPVYCYENAAKEAKRRNLATVRSGEYEGLKDKLAKPEWKPDFGPAEFRPRTGATAISARDFLIAVNFNLNTTSTRRANSVAFDVREAGRSKREGDPITGKIIRDENGEAVRVPGACKGTKAIGWYIEEYGVAQISMNITDIHATPLHVAFEEVRKSADRRGLRVTGTEIVGLVPLRVMLDAGRYFLQQQNRSTGIAEAEILKIAIKSMGLDDLKPFDPQENIIEYMIAEEGQAPLINLNLKDFAAETASESIAPGGGSISAYMGSLGVALGTMVANLSSHKRGWDHRCGEFSDWAEKGQSLLAELNFLVDEDTNAFNKIIDAVRLPKGTAEEKAARKAAMDDATRYAIEVPLRVMRTAAEAFPLLRAMAEVGNPNSVSDAGVGALAVRAAVRGAGLNVRINTSGFEDTAFVEKALAEAAQLTQHAEAQENEILALVEEKM